jgi:hypothetical protein
MAERAVNSFAIHHMDLHSSNLPAPVSLQGIYSGLWFSENLFSPFITGAITIDDSGGYLELLPIMGEEFLYIELEPDNIDSTLDIQTVGGYFRIYSISDLEDAGEGKKGKRYTLSFSSAEFMINAQTKTFKTFVDQKISTMVDTIYTRYIKNKIPELYQKELDVESTFTLRNYCASNINPLRAIDDLAEESISENINAGGATYVFFERFDKFCFKSIETLTALPPVKTLYYAPKGLTNEDESKDISSLGDQVDEYDILKTFDVLSNLQNGMYASKMIAIDLEQMSYQEHNYDYIPPQQLAVLQSSTQGTTTTPIIQDDAAVQQTDRATTIAPGKLCTQHMDALNNHHNMVNLTTTNFNHDVQYKNNLVRAGGFKEPGIRPTGIEQWGLARKSQLQQLQNLQVEVLLSHCNTNLHVGDMIEFIIPSEIAYLYDSKSADAEHFYFSGKYIIGAIRHECNSAEGMITMCQLMKNSLEHPLPNWNPEIDEELGVIAKTSTEEKQQQLDSVLQG